MKRSLVVFVALALVIMLVSCGGKSEPDQIAFSNDDSIYVMNADGTNLRQLTDGTASAEANKEDYESAWSPDGEKIAFKRSVMPTYAGLLHVMDADGTNLRQVIFEDYVNSPSWSPNGEQITFGGWNSTDIFVVDADGSDLRQLTDLDSFDDCLCYATNPSWSPDGEQIAYLAYATRNRWDADPGIFVMDADGTDSRQIAVLNRAFAKPVWSPDGKKIAFSDASNGNLEIFVMNADGSDVTQLTFNTGSQSPAWSPDGKRIAFNRYRDGRPEIFVMDADGSNVISTNQRGIQPAFKP